MAVNGEYVAEVQAENQRLRQQLEQAQARVAELNACINQAFHIASAKPKDYAIMMALGPDASRAWLLRKQAEAVEDFGQPFDRMHRMVASREVAEGAFDYAQRLRQQADQLESNDETTQP